ncbi:hypothetical protein [Anaeromicropila herbilytica]|uniref:Uncharacterized protein n=1 Tax=Anaeromicropila herbilytica TaxID=2785025 RepID=A0A7R7ID00_9FIRM|nr:hypothetical protein [Anaeromicropila herbilytica]BCN29513.1 hypothetical protein bsdtb5_08080 [Anaeromicropila herbilytica]
MKKEKNEANRFSFVLQEMITLADSQKVIVTDPKMEFQVVKKKSTYTSCFNDNLNPCRPFNIW